MKYLKRLKSSSLYKLIINNLFLIVVNIVILIICLNYYYFFIILFCYISYIYKKNRKFFYLILIIDIILLLSYYLHYLLIKDYGYNNFEGVVVNINYYEDYNKLTIKKGLIKVLVYDYDCLNIQIGDQISVSGINRKITPNRIEGLFNYQKYYFSQNIIGIIRAEEIKYHNNFNIYYLRRLLYQYINNTFDKVSSSYMLGMILGDSTTIESDAVESIRINGISHLFAISGLHITLLVAMLSEILKILKINENVRENSISFILCIYVIITNFAVSILRASLMYILAIISKRFKLHLTSIDIISLIFIVLVLINPYYVYNLSFILSFSASFCIIILSQTFKEYEVKLNSVVELVLITTILQIATLPIVVNLNNSLNVLSIITNAIFITLVTSIVLPTTFLILFFPFLKIIYQYMILSFNFLNDFFAKYISLNLILPSFTIEEILLYYILLFSILTLWHKINRHKKIILFTLLGIFLIGYYQKVNLNIDGKVYFLDIYEGDCTIIDLPMNKGVIIIDTGTGECKDVLSFLKSKGIRKIDYLVLTHQHNDHCGNAWNILNNFDVNKVVVSAYNDSSLPNKVVLRFNESFSLNGYTFRVLGPIKKDLIDENNNSLIIYGKIGNLNYLFLGDATKEIEEELIKYNLDVDCVKVGHHGSRTSSSELFYNSINPKYVFIETGRVEKFGFPHHEAMEVLNKYQVYRTDLNYSITVKFNQKRSIIDTLK